MADWIPVCKLCQQGKKAIVGEGPFYQPVVFASTNAASSTSSVRIQKLIQTM